MSVALYFDVHVPQAVADQLRRRNVDVLTATEDGAARFDDDVLLRQTTDLGRVIVTFDVRFKAMAEDWQRAGKAFVGLIYAHPMRVSIGQLVNDLELVAKATDAKDWQSAIEHLPL
jgi:hypothetical protein